MLTVTKCFPLSQPQIILLVYLVLNYLNISSCVKAECKNDSCMDATSSQVLIQKDEVGRLAIKAKYKEDFMIQQRIKRNLDESMVRTSGVSLPETIESEPTAKERVGREGAEVLEPGPPPPPEEPEVEVTQVPGSEPDDSAVYNYANRKTPVVECILFCFVVLVPGVSSRTLIYSLRF